MGIGVKSGSGLPDWLAGLTSSFMVSRGDMAEREGFEPSIELLDPITV